MLHVRQRKEKRIAAAAWAAWILFAGLALFMAGAIAPSPDASHLLAALIVPAAGLCLMGRRRRPRIPVLNYHSVSDRPDWLSLRELSLAPRLFEAQLQWLSRNGYRTLFVSEVHDLLSGRRAPAPGARYVALTFDDGYADHWVAVVPLLRKYGMKATFFVSPDFIEDGDGVRPTLDDKPSAELEWEGYLTWPEIRAMQDAGVAEIQSHGKAHARVVTSPQIRRFVSPQTSSVWVFWNTYRTRKAAWWRAIRADRSLWGRPVFAMGPALTHRAFLPDPRADRHLKAVVNRQGDAFFSRPEWDKRLAEHRRSYLGRHGDESRRETGEEYAARVQKDLRSARRLIEAETGHPVRFLCWPENASTEEAERIAAAVGYDATVSNHHDTCNRIGEDAAHIGRAYVLGDDQIVRGRRLHTRAFMLKLRFLEGRILLYPAVMAIDGITKLGRRLTCRTHGSIWRS